MISYIDEVELENIWTKPKNKRVWSHYIRFYTKKLEKNNNFCKTILLFL